MRNKIVTMLLVCTCVLGGLGTQACGEVLTLSNGDRVWIKPDGGWEKISNEPTWPVQAQTNPNTMRFGIGTGTFGLIELGIFGKTSDFCFAYGTQSTDSPKVDIIAYSVRARLKTPISNTVDFTVGGETYFGYISQTSGVSDVFSWGITIGGQTHLDKFLVGIEVSPITVKSIKSGTVESKTTSIFGPLSSRIYVCYLF